MTCQIIMHLIVRQRIKTRWFMYAPPALAWKLFCRFSTHCIICGSWKVQQLFLSRVL